MQQPAESDRQQCRPSFKRHRQQQEAMRRFRRLEGGLAHAGMAVGRLGELRARNLRERELFKLGPRQTARMMD